MRSSSIVPAASLLLALVSLLPLRSASLRGNQGECSEGHGDTLTLTFTGDLLLDRGVRRVIESSNSHQGSPDSLRCLDCLFSSSIDSLLRASQVVVANLECPATKVKAPVFKRFIFRAEPEWLPALRHHGITHLNLANNHSIDQGRQGLMDTRQNIIAAGMTPIGAGSNMQEASQPVLGSVTVERNIAYIGASDSTFRAIDIRTGHLVWSYKGLRGYVMTKPLVTRDRVIFGAWDNTLYCLRKADGAELWRWTGGLTRMHFSPAQVWPVTSHGCVFIVDPQRAMTAIDIETGETRWRTFQSKVRESLGLSADGERLYAKTMQDSVVCYAAQGNEPRQLWATDAGIGYEHAPCMLPERDGIVYGSTNDGVSFALEGKTGRLLWRHKTGNSLMNTLVPLGKRRLLFSNSEGNVGILSY